jgi:hypothetical protein
MNRLRLLVAVIPLGALAVAPGGLAQQPATPPAARENVEAALKLTLAAAAEYEFRVGDGKGRPLELRREPVFRWSNPEAGDVHGNVFLWTRDGRPLVIGSLYKWFAPRTTMEHEFHSLAEEPLGATFHGEPVWKTGEAGVRFADLPDAPAPAAGETQRLFQLKQLAKEFSGTGKFGKNAVPIELRLLPQPVHRYAAPKQGVLTAGLFAFVRATDPEIVLLIEARGQDAASARWQYAVARMHSIAELRLRRQGRQVWEAEPLDLKELFERHVTPYTAFRFKEVPDFLGGPPAGPKQ